MTTHILEFALIALVLSGCLKPKNNAMTGSAVVGSEALALNAASNEDDFSILAEESSDEIDVIQTLDKRIKKLSARINLSGTIVETEDAKVEGNGIIVTAAGLKASKSGQMNIAMLDDNRNLLFTVLLSGVDVSSEGDFHITLSRCVLKKDPISKAEKLANCNWSSEQSLN